MLELLEKLQSLNPNNFTVKEIAGLLEIPEEEAMEICFNLIRSKEFEVTLSLPLNKN